MKARFSSLMNSKLVLLVISVLALTSFAAADAVRDTTSSWCGPRMSQMCQAGTPYAPQMFQAGKSSPGDPDIFFTFSLGGNTGYADLTATSLGGGEFLATAGTLVVTGGVDKGSYALIPGGPAPFISPSGYFEADNVLYPASDPVLDQYGLLFGKSGLEINIWGNSPGNYTFADNTGYSFTGSGTVTASVPEASSLATLLGFGIFNLATVFGFRRKLI